MALSWTYTRGSVCRALRTHLPRPTTPGRCPTVDPPTTLPVDGRVPSGPSTGPQETSRPTTESGDLETRECLEDRGPPILHYDTSFSDVTACSTGTHNGPVHEHRELRRVFRTNFLFYRKRPKKKGMIKRQGKSKKKGVDLSSPIKGGQSEFCYVRRKSVDELRVKVSSQVRINTYHFRDRSTPSPFSISSRLGTTEH